MSRINIDELTESELVDLNHRIVERLRLLHQIKAHSTMLQFKIGDRVTFDVEGRQPVEGILTRYNKKSVTVITEQGQRWNVSPALLRLVAAESESTSTTVKALPLKPKQDS